jgi:uncharacterized alpha-E superfamily protein
MDIPQGSEPGWSILVQILDAEPTFGKAYRAFNEQNVLSFLIADDINPGSIRGSVVAARENVRTTRDVLPGEVWEHVNELYIFAREEAEQSVGRRKRNAFLEQIITRCQMINGLIISTLCRDHAYRFIKLGHLLERADMTTRVIDVGAGALMGDERHHPAVDPLIWENILRSLSAMGTYRRTIGPIVHPDDVVDFVFREGTLPRSVRFCLNGIRQELAPLKHNREAMKVLERSRRKLARFNAGTASREQLHSFVDRIQAEFNALNDTIAATWFLPTEE